MTELTMYDVGRIMAADMLGVKTADVVTETGEGASMTPLQAGAVTAAGAAPFAGLIGQDKIIHDPMQGAVGKDFKSMEGLGRAARPGDVLVTTKPKGSVWKSFISPFSGSEFYHIQPVVGAEGGIGTTMTAGEHSYAPFNTMSLKDLKQEAWNIPDAMKREGYTDALLLRPKETTKAQRSAMSERNTIRSVRDYDTAQAMKAWLKEIFVPKIKGMEKLSPQVICQGNVCSTMPAQAMKEVTGRGIVPGKAAPDVFPTDFLRSQQFELVGSKLNPEVYKMSPRLRKALPYLVRGGIGAGLAGTTYATTEQPETAGGALGGAAASYAGTGAIDTYYGKGAKQEAKAQKALPDTFSMLASLSDEAPKVRKQIIKNWATRRVPLALGGIAAGAGLTYAVKKMLEEREAKKKTTE